MESLESVDNVKQLDKNESMGKASGEVSTEKTPAPFEINDNQFVTFLIASEVYGVEVLSVQEIIGMVKITTVPNSLSFMKGVINLRGTVVPVVDMRLKFGMEEKEYDSFTVIIIVEVKDKLIGMIVDSVSDVASIPVDHIQNTLHFTSKIESDYIKGIGQIGEELVVILDVEQILTEEELKNIDK